MRREKDTEIKRKKRGRAKEEERERGWEKARERESERRRRVSEANLKKEQSMQKKLSNTTAQLFTAF